MAEDQGVNGDFWNKEATRILSLFGWNTIGDHDMDIEGADAQKYGIDTLLKYDSPMINNPQWVVLEGKRYKTDSFSVTLLQEWTERLDKKLTELRYSEEVKTKFPELSECSTSGIGLIAIWFHDIDNYKTFRPQFLKALAGIKTSNKPKKSGGYNKVCIIDNSSILKLCSINKAIEDYKKIHPRCKVNFHYPSDFINDKPIKQSEVLTPEYIFSQVILAKCKDESGAEENIVFYFGELITSSFSSLLSLLTKCAFIECDKKLSIYIYKRDIDFRKIEPDVKKIFNEVDMNIIEMENLYDLPANIINIRHEE